MSEQLIAIASIDEPEFNSRLNLDAESVAELAATMTKPEDQINAITVEQVSDRYLLVTGSRRLAAAKLNGWKEIRADVKPKTNTLHRMFENFTENNQRKDLTLYEQAYSVAMMRRKGAKAPEITAATGYSKQKISNIAIMYEKLPPEIHDPWRAGNKAATFDFLRELAGIEAKTPEETKDAQIAAWDARTKLVGKYEEALLPDPEPCPKKGCLLDKGHDGEHETKPEKVPSEKKYHVPHARLGAIKRALKKSGVKGGELAVQCMSALVGLSNEIPGVWNVDAGDNPS